ncbi:MarR family transcriptional regulator [Actinoallomurus sp. NBC_01490]|uniref:MarR family winged helix-turn-helix transcriptional regulator n=1 Tax=Actinoallomurus sp. NBC_01490 TaxID=2903557 RepID=UPI002E2F75BC|nr:MarR family transcriptional regulator [Actinoallomurus sp. NBC_01490]
MTDDLGAEDVAAALLVSMSLFRRRMRQVPVQEELTLPETAALSRLDRSGPTTASAMARAEQISPQSMGATLGALESRGLVDRRPDPEDGRRVVLSVTEAGRALLRDKRTARIQQIAQVLAAEFTPEELRRLMAAVPLIERLAQSI